MSREKVKKKESLENRMFVRNLKLRSRDEVQRMKRPTSQRFQTTLIKRKVLIEKRTGNGYLKWGLLQDLQNFLLYLRSKVSNLGLKPSLILLLKVLK